MADARRRIILLALILVAAGAGGALLLHPAAGCADDRCRARHRNPRRT